MAKSDDLRLKKRFPPEPLLEFIARRAKEHEHATCNGRPHPGKHTGYAWVAFVFGRQSNMERQLTRWRKGESLSWWYADRVAGLLGVHPVWIWSDWYDEVDDESVAA